MIQKERNRKRLGGRMVGDVERHKKKKKKDVCTQNVYCIFGSTSLLEYLEESKN
jgi:hypothetical protein